MARFILIRIGQGIIVLFLMSVLVFGMSRLTGNPAILMVPEYATAEDVQYWEQKLGLDKPLPEQYGIFLSNVLRGDFGRSIRDWRPALQVFLERVPATAKLCGSALLLALAFGFLFGISAAVKNGSFVDSFVRTLALLGQSAPSFVVGIVFMYFFALQLGVLPAAGYGGIGHLILPATTLSLYFVAAITRLLRGSMLDTLGKDYIRLARIKGLKERVVILKHALKNSVIPVITYAGPLSVTMITAALAIEVVFGWPGIGRLAFDSTVGKDFPVIQTTVLILCAALIFINLIVDILYAWIDPRIRFWK
jgi:ABC-type dipeptide/oligopeptide/nickel transport system permease component